jgi:hypothetical protein
MQPTYLPWAGYFNLISRVDVFVFYDDAQFQKSSWHNRNRILVNGKVKFITVPAKRNSLQQKICETKINDISNWRNKQRESIKQNYGKCRYYRDIEPILEILENRNLLNLADLNIKIIEWAAVKLGIRRTFVRSSQLTVKGARLDKLLSILNAVNAEVYLSPVGAKDYLTNDNFENHTAISIEYQNFTLRAYEQRNNVRFQPGLSILDVVANIGWAQAQDYVSKRA